MSSACAVCGQRRPGPEMAQLHTAGQLGFPICMLCLKRYREVFEEEAITCPACARTLAFIDSVFDAEQDFILTHGGGLVCAGTEVRPHRQKCPNDPLTTLT